MSNDETYATASALAQKIVNLDFMVREAEKQLEYARRELDSAKRAFWATAVADDNAAYLVANTDGSCGYAVFRAFHHGEVQIVKVAG